MLGELPTWPALQRAKRTPYRESALVRGQKGNSLPASNKGEGGGDSLGEERKKLETGVG